MFYSYNFGLNASVIPKFLRVLLSFKTIINRKIRLDVHMRHIFSFNLNPIFYKSDEQDAHGVIFPTPPSMRFPRHLQARDKPIFLEPAWHEFFFNSTVYEWFDARQIKKLQENSLALKLPYLYNTFYTRSLHKSRKNTLCSYHRRPKKQHAEQVNSLVKILKRISMRTDRIGRNIPLISLITSTVRLEVAGNASMAPREKWPPERPVYPILETLGWN